MALKTMSLVASGTISVTGGSAQVFTDNGVTIPNGVQVVVPADTDYQTRRHATFKYRPPSVDPKTNVYGKDKKSVSYAVPVVLPTGQVVFNTIRIEREVHPSYTAASCTELNKIGAQLLVDTDLDGFWATGSLS